MAEHGFSGALHRLRHPAHRAATTATTSTGPADLKGKKIGVRPGHQLGELGAGRTRRRGGAHRYDDDPTKYADLKAGRIDAVLNATGWWPPTSSSARANCSRPPARPSRRRSQGVAFKPDPELKAAIDQAIAAMRADGELAALSKHLVRAGRDPLGHGERRWPDPPVAAARWPKRGWATRWALPCSAWPPGWLLGFGLASMRLSCLAVTALAGGAPMSRRCAARRCWSSSS